MEQSKRFGKSSFAKHLRKKKGKWTKAMANSKSRLKTKRELTNVDFIENEFDKTEWTW